MKKFLFTIVIAIFLLNNKCMKSKDFDYNTVVDENLNTAIQIITEKDLYKRIFKQSKHLIIKSKTNNKTAYIPIDLSYKSGEVWAVGVIPFYKDWKVLGTDHNKDGDLLEHEKPLLQIESLHQLLLKSESSNKANFYQKYNTTLNCLDNKFKINVSDQEINKYLLAIIVSKKNKIIFQYNGQWKQYINFECNKDILNISIKLRSYSVSFLLEGAYGFDIPVKQKKQLNLNTISAYGFDIPLEKKESNNKESIEMINEKGFDIFGNPKDKIYGLGEVDNELLKNERILLYVGYNGQDEDSGNMFFQWQHVQESLAKRQIHIDTEYASNRNHCSLNNEKLKNYTQLWFVSDRERSLTQEQVLLIEKYVSKGNGLLIWTENEPFYADANLLAERIIGTKFSGNIAANNIMSFGKTLKPGFFIEHPLTQGINKLYEGLTISAINPLPQLNILAQTSEGHINMACFENNNTRVVLDTAYSKLSSNMFYNTAGTARYFRNIAFWLSKTGHNFKYSLLTPGRDNIATIQTGEISEHYRFQINIPSKITVMLSLSEKAKIRLILKNPNGKIVHNRIYDNNGICISLNGDIIGEWECWIEGIDVFQSEQEYVLIVRKEN